MWEWATHTQEPECQSAALMNHGSEAGRKRLRQQWWVGCTWRGDQMQLNGCCRYVGVFVSCPPSPAYLTTPPPCAEYTPRQKLAGQSPSVQKLIASLSDLKMSWSLASGVKALTFTCSVSGLKLNLWAFQGHQTSTKHMADRNTIMFVVYAQVNTQQRPWCLSKTLKYNMLPVNKLHWF